jgi:hypothetical protein
MVRVGYCVPSTALRTGLRIAYWDAGFWILRRRLRTQDHRLTTDLACGIGDLAVRMRPGFKICD